MVKLPLSNAGTLRNEYVFLFVCLLFVCLFIFSIVNLSPVEFFYSYSLRGSTWRPAGAFCMGFLYSLWYCCFCLAAANAICSPQCGEHGCWGPGSDQCVRCPQYRRNDTRVCLQSCDEEPRLYADDSAPQKQCRPCDPQCLNGCTGPVATAFTLSDRQYISLYAKIYVKTM